MNNEAKRVGKWNVNILNNPTIVVPVNFYEKPYFLTVFRPPDVVTKLLQVLTFFTFTGEAVILIFPHDTASSGLAPESLPSNSWPVFTNTEKSAPLRCERKNPNNYKIFTQRNNSLHRNNYTIILNDHRNVSYTFTEYTVRKY